MNVPPTAVQTVVLTQLIAFSAVVFVPSGVQLVPPFEVVSTDPSVVETKQTIAVGQLTPVKEVLVPTPEVCGVHVVPPFVVVTMLPAPPTATQDEALAQLTPNKLLVAGEDCALQLVPPSTVVQIPVPTAKQSDAVGQLSP